MKLTDKTYLGSLCKREHDYENTGQSLRFRAGCNCVQCQHDYQRSDDFRAYMKIYRQKESHKKYNREYQREYRKK